MEQDQMTDVALIPVEDIKEIIASAPEALSLNSDLIAKAVGAGEKLLAKVKGNMNEELDKECNDYLVKLRDRLPVMKSRREPVTKMFDRIRSVFTALEKQIDPKEKESIYSKIQKERDDYATAKMLDQKRKEEMAQKQLAIEREKIELKSQMEMQLQKYFSDHITTVKTKMNNAFEALTLPTFEKDSEAFTGDVPTYSLTHFKNFAPQIRASVISHADAQAIVAAVNDGKYDQFCHQYKNEITAYKQELFSKLQSKKKELEAIALAKANANAAEIKRLEEMEAERKASEALRFAESQRKQEEAAKAAADAAKAVETTNAVFAAQMEMQMDEPVQVREGYEIELKHVTAYLQIVAFYFEKEGKNKSVEDLKKKTLDSMVTFCEKHAMKNNEKIDSPYIIYKETFKTTVKK